MITQPASHVSQATSEAPILHETQQEKTCVRRLFFHEEQQDKKKLALQQKLCDAVTAVVPLRAPHEPPNEATFFPLLDRAWGTPFQGRRRTRSADICDTDQPADRPIDHTHTHARVVLCVSVLQFKRNSIYTAALPNPSHFRGEEVYAGRRLACLMFCLACEHILRVGWMAEPEFFSMFFNFGGIKKLARQNSGPSQHRTTPLQRPLTPERKHASVKNNSNNAILYNPVNPQQHPTFLHCPCPTRTSSYRYPNLQITPVSAFAHPQQQQQQ